MLRELDASGGGLGVRSYGLSVTTMEEVFLNVSRAATSAAAHQQHTDGAGSARADAADQACA